MFKSSEEEEESPQSSSFSKKLFNFVGNTLGMKNVLSRAFLYHPPMATYVFDQKQELPLQLKLKKGLLDKHKEIPKGVSYDLYILHFETLRNNKPQQIPVIHIQNSKTQGNQVIIYNHGNSCDLGGVFYTLIRLSKVYKVNVIAYDYRGYGISVGETSEENTYEDCEITISFALKTLNYKINELILWGFSLGSGPAVHLASKYENIRGLILEAPLASVFVYLENEVDPSYSQKEGDVYGNLYKIGKVKCPIILMHGKSDEIIPFKHSQLLYEKYKRENESHNIRISCMLIEDLKHNDISSLIQIKKSLTATKIKQFISKLLTQTSIDEEYLKMQPANNKGIEEEQTNLLEYNLHVLVNYKIQQ